MNAKSFFFILAALAATVSAQAAESDSVSVTVEYAGHSYRIKKACIGDSLLSFFPYDEARYAEASQSKYYENGHKVYTYELPDAPGQTVKLNPDDYSEVLTVSFDRPDEESNAGNIQLKRDYINRQLRAISEVRELLADVEALPKSTTPKGKQVYKELCRHAECTSKKALQAAAERYKAALAEEEAGLLKLQGISDFVEFLGTPVPKMSTELGGDSYYQRLRLKDRYGSMQEDVLRPDQLLTRRQILRLRNPLLSATPVSVPNPAYRSPEQREWEWLDVSLWDADWKKTVNTYPTVDEFYVHRDHPQYKCRPTNRADHGENLLVFEGDKLVRVRRAGKGASLYEVLYQKDFRDNKYGIQSESALAKEAIRFAIGMNFNRNRVDLLMMLASFAPWDKNLLRKYGLSFEAAAKAYKVVTNFTTQLETDHKGELTGGTWTRLSPTSFLFTSADGRLRFRETYVQDGIKARCTTELLPE